MTPRLGAWPKLDRQSPSKGYLELELKEEYNFPLRVSRWWGCEKWGWGDCQVLHWEEKIGLRSWYWQVATHLQYSCLENPMNRGPWHSVIFYFKATYILFFRSMQQLLDYPEDDVEETFCLNFTVRWKDIE